MVPSWMSVCAAVLEDLKRTCVRTYVHTYKQNIYSALYNRYSQLCRRSQQCPVSDVMVKNISSVGLSQWIVVK